MTKAIIGGGLSGLSAAYYLTKKLPGSAITLIESSKRVGGWIKSNIQDNGVIFEQGPRTIRPRGAAGENTLQLVEDLGLADQIVPILSKHPAARNRMIYANGKLHLLPSSLYGLFKKQTPFSKPLIFHLMNDLWSSKKSVSDESIYDFIDRRFGKEVADYLISPLISGICAGNAKEISVQFLMKNLFEYEQKYGSISKGVIRSFFEQSNYQKPTNKLCLKVKQEHWSIYSFVNGCETLPLALEKNLHNNGVNIMLNTSCNNVLINKNEVELHLNNGETSVVDHLISTVPAKKLSILMEKQHPHLADLLKQIRCVSVAVVNLKFDKKLLKSEGFGLLVAPKERLPILGVIYDSCCFPKDDSSTVLTVMMGGYWFEEHFGKNPQEQQFLDTALNQLHNILNIQEEPKQFKINILRDCIPQYTIGHNKNLEKIKDYINKYELPISLCGASYYGVGINDVILSAKNVVENLRFN